MVYSFGNIWTERWDISRKPLHQSLTTEPVLDVLGMSKAFNVPGTTCFPIRPFTRWMMWPHLSSVNLESFEVLTAVLLNVQVFCNVTLCFVGAYCLHLRGKTLQNMW